MTLKLKKVLMAMAALAALAVGGATIANATEGFGAAPKTAEQQQQGNAKNSDGPAKAGDKEEADGWEKADPRDKADMGERAEGQDRADGQDKSEANDKPDAGEKFGGDGSAGATERGEDGGRE